MKRKFTLSTMLLALAGISFGQSGDIMNGDFENWSTTTIYEYPDQWGNSNSGEWRGVACVEKSLTASDGTYSVKLKADTTMSGDTLRGYVYHGTVGSNGPDGGISYTDTFDEVTFDYQSNLVTGDSLYLFLIRFASGSMVDMQAIPVVYGVHPSWQSGSISVSATAQDELFIGFVLGNPDNNELFSLNAFALIDNVVLKNNGTAVSDLPNRSFETWSSQSYEGPDDWYTMNDLLAGAGAENCNKSIDAHTGSYAVELKTDTIPMFGGDTIPGFISIGPINFVGGGGSPFLPLAYDANPGNFSGTYKYTPSNGDQGMIYLEFYNNGSAVGNSIQYLSATSGYQTFTYPLSLTMTPDSMILVCGAGNNPGSVLLIDNFALTGGNVSVFESEMEIEMYPNPASEYFIMNIDEEYNYEIFSMEGRRVANQFGLFGWTSVDVSDLAAGKYIVKISTAGKTINKPLIVE